MNKFITGLAAGMAVSAGVAVACMPKRSAAKKRIAGTVKSVMNLVDDISDMIKG